MENKQTAVDWLEEELAKNLKHIVEKQDYILMESLFTKAKEMVEEQISNGYFQGLIDGMNNSPRDYYRKTFKQQDHE